ncbi:related to Probable metabolite transport protein YFL040W [Saccharomycodes ludwigii]|uniref:Related to Probable metabolite transport protein YFL040W n=1 Tax=Saccharomycodes ludwigii TaxID=36035 RepID=A0A376B469_9ASCO|nr:hypothetical protein SCDLUD_000842 [Saccharomycodes ludwigii]KAH3903223.1 hypothetical protein SCDLUD_000842 [Saccharomycodes ludwigii]SSD59473.1 related to Probable metabolite transport protein YFL040W [Saccharomycodes ludwigii]
MKNEKFYSVTRIIIILALGGLLLGLDISSMSIFIGSEFFNKYFNYPTPLQQGLISGSNPSGGLIGCLLSSTLSEKLGFPNTARLTALVWLFGSVVASLSFDIWWVILSRFFKGISIGIFSSSIPVYISEIIPSNKKGLVTSTMQWALTWGILLMFYITLVAEYYLGNTAISFRLSWAIEGLPGLLLFFVSWGLPESPSWLIMHGELSKLEKIVRELKGEKFIENKIDLINKTEMTATNNSDKRLRFIDLFKRPILPHLLCGIVMQSLVQFCGIGVLMYYMVYICEMIGLRNNLKLWATSLQYIFNVIFTIFPIMLMDKLKRKDIIVYGSYLLSLCMIIIGTILGVYGHEVAPINGNTAVVWEIKGIPGTIVLTFCYVFVSIFAASLSCAAWVYTNEILPTVAKVKGTSVCMSFSWFFNFILTFMAPCLLSKIKWGTFIMFGTMSFLLNTLIVYKFPETKGLKDEEVAVLFISNREDVDNKITEEQYELDRAAKNNKYHVDSSIKNSSISNDSTPFNEQNDPSKQSTISSSIFKIRGAPF